MKTPFNSTNTQTCTYSHDDLARIASGNCGSVWSQTFSYDAFGNITKAGTNSFNPGYNAATNRMSSGATYDTNGDVLTDSLHSFAWDVETRPTTIDTVTATYDALGRMVEQTKSGISTEIQYAPTGFKMQTLNGQTVKSAFIPLPGGTVLVPQCACYFHADWLGGSRFSSTYSNRTMHNDLAYAPFGEQYATAGGTGVGNATFAGNRNDTTTNLYDAQNREYEITGRWPSPDPAGIAAANPANPQSWNRYAYVLNSPLSYTDTSGLWTGVCGTILHGWPDEGLTWTEPIFCFIPSFPEPQTSNNDGGGGGHSPKLTQKQKNCQQGLKEAGQDMSAVNRAVEDWGMIEDAAEASGVDPAMIAAIGVRETGFEDVNEVDGAGVGVGIYQITVQNGPGYTVGASQANDPSTAALIVGGMLNYNLNYMANNYPSYTGTYLLQAAAAMYNMAPINKNTGKSNFSGNPATIDQGTADTTPGGTGNYGSDILLLMDCFQDD